MQNRGAKSGLMVISVRVKQVSVGVVLSLPTFDAGKRPQHGTYQKPASGNSTGCLLILLFQLLFDGCDHFFRIRCDFWFETLHYAAIAIYEELGEVPLDIAAHARSGVFR